MGGATIMWAIFTGRLTFRLSRTWLCVDQQQTEWWIIKVVANMMLVLYVILTTLRTLHVKPNCDCQSLSVPYDDLLDIARKGEIPIISVVEQTRPDLASVYRFQVHPRRKLSKYVAISHVWSDGLGNPEENALPLCQVKKLQAIIESVHESHEFRTKVHDLSFLWRNGSQFFTEMLY